MSHRRATLALATGLASLLAAGIAVAEPRIVISLPPIHALVAGVMDGVAMPELLVKGGASPHTFTLRPSDARALDQADAVFWVGPGLETFLVRSLETLSADARTVRLAEAEGMILLPLREGGPWDAHDHDNGHGHDGDHAHDDHDHDDHDHHGHGHAHEGGYDGHIWLDPRNARTIVRVAVATLSDLDPGNAGTYAANGEALQADLAALDAELAETLAPVAGVPFIAFHDAYQYLEARYGLNAVGSITVSPEQPPGARRMSELRGRVSEGGARCVFAEPQFPPALAATVLEGTEAQLGTLDPEGTSFEPGIDLYSTMMRALAANLVDCLAPAE